MELVIEDTKLNIRQMLKKMGVCTVSPLPPPSTSSSQGTGDGNASPEGEDASDEASPTQVI